MRQQRSDPSGTTVSGRPSRAGQVVARPYRKLAGSPEQVEAVIRRLADGDKIVDIAKDYGLADHSQVSRFRARHLARINAVRAELEQEAADRTGLWVADKVKRVAVLQDQAERILAQIEDADGPAPELERTLTATLHEVAEQLGQLPARTVVAATTVVNYTFHGVELDKL